jgi:hypothetical protein
MSKPAVFGIVDNDSQARNAILELESVGFIANDISVLSQCAPDMIEVGETDGFARTRDVGHKNSTKAPEGTTAGVTTGGAIGGLAGWLIGIGALAIPGVGPLVAAGPILAALSGAAVGAAAGGIAGALIGYGIPEYEAKLYAGRLEEGHILIGVHTINCDEAEAAKKALTRVGAHDLKVTSEVELNK